MATSFRWQAVSLILSIIALSLTVWTECRRYNRIEESSRTSLPDNNVIPQTNDRPYLRSKDL